MLKLKLQHFGHLMQRADSLGKNMMGKIEGRGRRGVTEDEMAAWHHQLNGHEFENTPRDSEGHGNLVCCEVKSEVSQSCPTLCNPMNCSLPGSSVHGIF